MPVSCFEAAPHVRDCRIARSPPPIVGRDAPGVGARRGDLYPSLSARIRDRSSSAVLVSIVHGDAPPARATTDRPRVGWWLPVVVAIWVNLHGAVLTGLAVVIAWWVAERCTSLLAGAPLATRCLPVLVSFAALIVNPWGPAILEFLRGAVSARPELTEWNPIEFAGLEGVLLRHRPAVRRAGVHRTMATAGAGDGGDRVDGRCPPSGPSSSAVLRPGDGGACRSRRW